jgi:hypothetical protein
MRLMACLLMVCQQAAKPLYPSGVGDHLDLVATGRQRGEAYLAWAVSGSDGRRQRWMHVSCCRVIRVEAGGMQVALEGVCSSQYVRLGDHDLDWMARPTSCQQQVVPGVSAV